jgi:membrane protease YdiL (CAAX protease family)
MSGQPMRSARVLRTIEFAVLFVLIPLLPASGVLPRNPFFLLLPLSFIMLCLLRADPEFDRVQLLNAAGAGAHLRAVLLRAALLLPILGLLVRLFAPELLFSFPRQRPLVWSVVMLLYPLLSVYPQELVFRAFLFHRYRDLYPTPPAQVWASALAFGFVHILFGNWLSVLLSTLGGVLFARTYARSRSLLLVTIEHAIYGDFIFTIGLGQFFYHGAR